MCGLCGMLGSVLPSAVETFEPAADDAAGRARGRRRRVQLLNRLLRPYRLTVSEFGAALVLRSATGRTAIVTSLTALWPAAERLSGRTCDPLDPLLVVTSDA